MIKCRYFPKCNACSLWDKPYEQQKEDKISAFITLLRNLNINYSNEIKFLSSGQYGLRHKADFGSEYIENEAVYKFGYYDDSGRILDISECLQYSPELQSIFTLFLKHPYPKDLKINKSSVRIRVGPNNQKGLWLDMANSDIKKILDEKNYLISLIKEGFIIELGQRKKILTFVDDKLKLKEPEVRVWFKTWDDQDIEHELFCHISSFTQPSWTSGRLLIQELRSTLKKNNPKHIVEFGAGIGFFSKLLSNAGAKLTILEVDQSSILPLKKNLSDRLEKIDIKIGNYHKEKFLLSHDFAFVNPARSGLKNFAHDLTNALPERVAYVSCFPDSMVSDLQILSSKYEICNISIIDQFPQTRHYEVFCELKRI